LHARILAWLEGWYTRIGVIPRSAIARRANSRARTSAICLWSGRCPRN